MRNSAFVAWTSLVVATVAASACRSSLSVGPCEAVAPTSSMVASATSSTASASEAAPATSVADFHLNLGERRLQIESHDGCLTLHVVFFSGRFFLDVPSSWPGGPGLPAIDLELDGAPLPVQTAHPKLNVPKISLGVHSVYGFRVFVDGAAVTSGKHRLRLIYRDTGLTTKAPARLESNVIDIDCK